MLATRNCFVVREISKNSIGIIWLANESKKNALNHEMLVELKASLGSFENDKSIRCIVIAGKGDHFSIGVDLATINKRIELIPINEELDKLKKPIIAAVHGYVV